MSDNVEDGIPCKNCGAGTDSPNWVAMHYPSCHEVKSLRASLTTEREKNAALAVRVGELKEEFEHALESWQSGWGATPNGKPYDMNSRYKKVLSLPDTAKSVLAKRDAEIWREAKAKFMVDAKTMLKGWSLGRKVYRTNCQKP